MTADAFALDPEMTLMGFGDGDPDATWTDLLRGRRGRKLPEAATAFLPAARTQCLTPPDPSEVATVRPEQTRLGALVPQVEALRHPLGARLAPQVEAGPGAEDPRDDLPDVATVFEYRELDLPDSSDDFELVRAVSPRPSPLPALEPAPGRSASGTPWCSDEGPRSGLASLAYREGARPPSPADGAPPTRSERDPSERPPRRGSTTPQRRSSPPPDPEGLRVVVGLPTVPGAAGRLPLVDLSAPAGLQANIPGVPTWAGCATQMEGPGVWVEERQSVQVRNPTVIQPQRSVSTMISPLPEPPLTRRRPGAAEILPFALVLLAISLATAALVGAYL